MTSYSASDVRIHPTTPGTPKVLRRLNQLHVLRATRESGPMSRPQIAAATGLSKVTVREVVADLLLADLIVEEDMADDRPAKRGPRPRVLSFRGNSRHVMGVDIGAAKALVWVADLWGHRVSERRRSTASCTSREQVLNVVRGAMSDALSSAGLTVADLAAVGIGTPGVVHPDTGIIALAPQLPGWNGMRLSEELSLPDDVPVHVANEVHLAVLGEQWRGAAIGVNEAVYVHLGVGVGVGLIVGGNLHTGATGAAGEIGYLPIVTEDDIDRPPDTGRFEWLVGGGAYARHAARALAAGEGEAITAHDPDRKGDAAAVFRAAAAEDPTACAIVSEVVGLTAHGIAAMITMLDPATIIVGGGVASAGEGLMRPLIKSVSALVPQVPDFALSVLGDQAVVVGAVRLALNAWETHAFSVES